MAYSRGIGYRNINFYAGNQAEARVALVLRRRKPGPWSWDEVRARTVAIYLAERGDRLRSAVLIWQGDDRQVAVGGATPPLLAFTMDVELEADEGNAVSLSGFESLEAARTHCAEWVGAATEADWDALGEAAQIAVYATVREPSFAAS